MIITASSGYGEESRKTTLHKGDIIAFNRGYDEFDPNGQHQHVYFVRNRGMMFTYAHDDKKKIILCSFRNLSVDETKLLAEMLTAAIGAEIEQVKASCPEEIRYRII